MKPCYCPWCGAPTSRQAFPDRDVAACEGARCTVLTFRAEVVLEALEEF